MAFQSFLTFWTRLHATRTRLHATTYARDDVYSRRQVSLSACSCLGGAHLECDVFATYAGVIPSLPSCNPNASRTDERPVQLTRTDRYVTWTDGHVDNSDNYNDLYK